MSEQLIYSMIYNFRIASYKIVVDLEWTIDFYNDLAIYNLWMTYYDIVVDYK